MENDNNNALGTLLSNSTVIAHINSYNNTLNKSTVSKNDDNETQDFEYPSYDDEPINYDRPQPTIVEGFTILPGEIVLMSTKNVVNLSLTSTTHRIGTLYQTNYQMFFIDDSTRQMVSTIPNGQLLEIKKLKGHVTVKYHDNAALPTTNTTTDPLNSFSLEKQPSQNENLNNNIVPTELSPTPPTTTHSNSNHKRLLKSTSTPIDLNNSHNNHNDSPLLSSSTTTTNTTWVNGYSEKALILEIRCKDFMITRYCLPFNERGNEAFELMNKLINENHNTFAKTYSPYKSTIISPSLINYDGWLFYDPVEEYTRQGLIGGNGSEWRISKINYKFELCSTYPQLLVIPFSISDYLLNKSASFRNKNRFPICTWRHKLTNASLSRSSQPKYNSSMVVSSKSRCEEDELLIQAIRKSQNSSKSSSSSSSIPSNTLIIIDIRSSSSGGPSISNNHEDISHYTNCQLEIENQLPNIHELRESQLKLFKVIRNWNEKKGWSEIQSTGWLDGLSKLLQSTKKILNFIHSKGQSVLIHCVDGWDRTCQLTSLVQLCADPFYRTIKGFIVLISKEWLSFGHKFMTRNNINDGSSNNLNNNETSPVFLQFIDAVWQLTKQFPTSFEFSDRFLGIILHHLNSNLFGTFLYDSDKDRLQNKVSSETQSLWSLLLSAQKNSSCLNPLFNNQELLSKTPSTSTTTTTTSDGADINNVQPQLNNNEDGVLFPNSKGVQLWSDYYLKWRNPPKASRKSNTIITHSLGISYINGDLITVQKRRRSRRSNGNGVSSSSGSSGKHHRNKSDEKDPSKPSKSKLSSSSSSKRKSSSSTSITKAVTTTNKIAIETIDINDKQKINEQIVIQPEQDDNQFKSQLPNNQMESSIEISPQQSTEKKEIRTYSMESEHKSSGIEYDHDENENEKQLEPIIEYNEQQDTINTTTTTTTTTTASSASKLEKELRRQEKEKRKLEKEKKLNERTERKLEKEKKREQKEKEAKEKELLEAQKPKADITFVLQSPKVKSKAISLTMPVRGSKSRISIFSSPLNQSTLHPNLIDNISSNNNSGANSGNVNNSPNLTSSTSTFTPNQINNNNNNDNESTNNNNNETSFSKRIFKTLRGTKSLQHHNQTAGTALN